MKIYAAEKIPGLPTNDIIVEHYLSGGIHGKQTRCYHYRVDDDVGRFWIRAGIALELKHRFDCATVPPPGAKTRKVY